MIWNSRTGVALLLLTQPIPEPAPSALLLSGLAGLAGMAIVRRRGRQKNERYPTMPVWPIGAPRSLSA